MLRVLIRPRWLALHLLAVVLVGVCVVLGLWQHSRYQEHARPVSRVDPAPVAVDEILPADGKVGTTVAGRRVVATGRYLVGEQLLVAGRELDGRSGLLVLTPLQLRDGTVLPVVRGWVSGVSAPIPAVPAAEVTVTGRLQPSDQPDQRSPGGGLPPGQVALISTAQLVNTWPFDLRDGYLVAVSQQPPSTPRLAIADAVPPGAHSAGNGRAWQNAAYTIQWFIFGGFVVFMWIRIVREEATRRRPGAQPRPDVVQERQDVVQERGLTG